MKTKTLTINYIPILECYRLELFKSIASVIIFIILSIYKFNGYLDLIGGIIFVYNFWPISTFVVSPFLLKFFVTNNNSKP